MGLQWGLTGASAEEKGVGFRVQSLEGLGFEVLGILDSVPVDPFKGKSQNDPSRMPVHL